MEARNFKENTERYSKEVIKLLKNSKRGFPDVNLHSISLDPTDVMSGIAIKNENIKEDDLKKLSKILQRFHDPKSNPNDSLNVTNMLKNNLFPNSKKSGTIEEFSPNQNTVESTVEHKSNSQKNNFFFNPNSKNANTENCESKSVVENKNSSQKNNFFFNPNIKNANSEKCEPKTNSSKNAGFITARDEMNIQTAKKFGSGGNSSSSSSSAAQPLFSYGTTKKSLGGRRSVRSNFTPPIKKNESTYENNSEPIDERLVNIDPKMIEMITNEIMHKFKSIDWDDIAGLEYAKSTIKEAVVWPLLRPDIFTGLRRPPRGILLFGPPGTGKTLIGKCIASQSKSTFFNISASSLTSKWIGDGEKMVRALFAVAAVQQPSVVFIDEIDSLLCQRSESEHESSRRIKTEFLVQLDGAATSEDERILIVGATNRPQELDEAARRRLVRRLYIPLPELDARIIILNNLLKTVHNCLKKEEILQIGKLTEGYSGADMETLCREASLEPIRSIPSEAIADFDESNVRPVNFQDFSCSLSRVRASVSKNDIQLYLDWNNTFGAGK